MNPFLFSADGNQFLAVTREIIAHLPISTGAETCSDENCRYVKSHVRAFVCLRSTE